MSVNLADAHFKASHTATIVVAIVTAGITVGTLLYRQSLKVENLARAQMDVATKEDLKHLAEGLHNSRDVDISHACAEKVKFYMKRATIEQVAGEHGRKWRLTWPPLETRRDDD